MTAEYGQLQMDFTEKKTSDHDLFLFDKFIDPQDISILTDDLERIRKDVQTFHDPSIEYVHEVASRIIGLVATHVPSGSILATFDSNPYAIASLGHLEKCPEKSCNIAYSEINQKIMLKAQGKII